LTTEGWQTSWRDARRFLLLRNRTERVTMLRARQAALAHRIESIVAEEAR